MKTRKSAISPIIASLLLIAIAVAAGIVVYVFTTGLSGTLTGGGGAQVTQQLQLEAYTFTPVGASGTGQIVDFFLKNVGSSSLTISSIYFDGSQLTEWGVSGGAYAQYLMVPTSVQNCFAAVPTTATATAVTSGSQTVSGAANACTGTGTQTCASTNFCLNTSSGQTETLTLSAQSANQFFVGLNTAQTAGSGHTIKIITSTGGQYLFTVLVGRTG